MSVLHYIPIFGGELEAVPLSGGVVVVTGVPSEDDVNNAQLKLQWDTTTNTLNTPSILVVKLTFSGSLLMVDSSTHTATISALYLVPPLRPLTLKTLVEWFVVDMDM